MNNPDLITPRRRPSRQYALWVVLLLSAGIPRILAAFLLPNEEGDPYSYVQAIQSMRSSIEGGTFTISDLFGFWLPLYQFICALISTVAGHPLYVAKLVSAVCGIGVCLFVFGVSVQLTENRILSLVAFALVAFNPAHIMYSAFSLTDIPHAFLVMASLYFAIKNRWVLAASLVAIGGLMRPEAWLFVALLPAVQFFLRRRVSLPAFIIALASPLVWLYVSWVATGNPFEYFKVRNEYVRGLIAENTNLDYFALSNVYVNLRTLFYAAGPAMILACLIAACLLMKRLGGHRPGVSEVSARVVTTLAYFFSSLGFLLVAYFTKNQPAIWGRYCLVLFALGAPVIAWILPASKEWKPAWATRLAVLFGALCLLQWAFQARDGVAFLSQVSQKRIVANFLRGNFQGSSNLKVFCDDDTIKVLSGMPADRFVSSTSSPTDSSLFLDYLKENRVEYLVYEKRDRSAAERLFRDLGEERTKDLFSLVATTSMDLRLYRADF